MRIFKARGIIIKENIINDRDKSLVILFKDYGKLNVWARNSRSSKSKLLAGSTLFTYGDFVINASNINSSSNFNNIKNLYINQVDIIKKFYDISQELDKVAIASYILELTDKNIQEASEVNDIMLLLLHSLNNLNNKNNIIPADIICKVYELKFLELSGYKPEIYTCTKCNNNKNNNNKNIEIYFDYSGYICNNCKNKYYYNKNNKNNKNLILVNKNLIQVLDYILKSPIESLFKFGLSKDNLNNLEALNYLLLSSNLQTPPDNLKSKSFLDLIKI